MPAATAEQRALILDLHARGIAGGLHARFWDLKKGALILALPDFPPGDGQTQQTQTETRSVAGDSTGVVSSREEVRSGGNGPGEGAQQ